MTLLDVLNTCPEFLSINGKKVDLDYKLRVDNIDFSLDCQGRRAWNKRVRCHHHPTKSSAG
jgi:hypothetical protein